MLFCTFKAQASPVFKVNELGLGTDSEIQLFSTFFNSRNLRKIIEVRRNLDIQNSANLKIIMEPSEYWAEPRLKNTAPITTLFKVLTSLLVMFSSSYKTIKHYLSTYTFSMIHVSFWTRSTIMYFTLISTLCLTKCHLNCVISPFVFNRFLPFCLFCHLSRVVLSHPLAWLASR